MESAALPSRSEPISAGAVAAKPARMDWTPWFLVAPNLLWLAAFMGGGLLVLAVMSLRGYVPGGVGIADTWELTHYVAFLTDGYTLKVLFRTLSIGVQVTALALILGFPLAVWLSRLRGTWRAMLYLVIFIPLITSAVVRTFGWMILLSNNGALNASLKAIGIIDGPLALLYTELGIVIALAEVLLPFMVLALDAALLNIDAHLYDAARSLGASRLRILVQVTIPLAAPGIVSGSILVFMMSVSAYVTPALVGGPQVPVMSTMIYQQSVSLLNWPFGAAMSFILLFTLVALLSATYACGQKTIARAS